MEANWTSYEAKIWKTISWQDIVVTVYFLEGVFFKSHEGFQVSLSSWSQFSEPVTKIYFLSGIILPEAWNK